MLKRHSDELTLTKMHLPELSDEDRAAAETFRQEMGAPRVIAEETYDRVAQAQ